MLKILIPADGSPQAEHHFDKIVIGRHGGGGLPGSVASEVLRHSPVAVTLVKPAA